jgi:hypothetical protein
MTNVRKKVMAFLRVELNRSIPGQHDKIVMYPHQIRKGDHHE